MASPLPRRSSSAATTQRVKDYDGGDFERKGKEKINSEKQKSGEEGKTSSFVSPLRIESRPLDHIQHATTAGGSKTRSTVGNISLFKR